MITLNIKGSIHFNIIKNCVKQVTKLHEKLCFPKNAGEMGGEGGENE